MTTLTPISVNYSEPNFKSRNKTKLVGYEKYPDYEVRKYETEASTGKKWGVGLASAWIPGLGQVINGDWGKGVGMFVLGNVVPFLGMFGSGVTSLAKLNTKKALSKGQIYTTLAMFGTSLVVGLGTKIWSVVDAVKNAKSEITQIIPTKG